MKQLVINDVTVSNATESNVLIGYVKVSKQNVIK